MTVKSAKSKVAPSFKFDGSSFKGGPRAARPTGSQSSCRVSRWFGLRGAMLRAPSFGVLKNRRKQSKSRSVKPNQPLSLKKFAFSGQRGGGTAFSLGDWERRLKRCGYGEKREGWRVHLDTATLAVRPSPAAERQGLWSAQEFIAGSHFPHFCARGRAHSVGKWLPDSVAVSRCARGGTPALRWRDKLVHGR